MKKGKVYFCGPFYVPRVIRKYLSRHFNLACKIHDKGYKNQSSSRKEVDDHFLKNMLHSVSQGRGTAMEAYIYYFLVRYIVGYPSWVLNKLYKLVKTSV